MPTGTLQLLDVIGLPAFVEDRAFDVLAANALATELAPGLRAGENRLRTMFLDDAETARYPDWQDQMAGMVAAFRASIGTDVQEPAVTALVGELSLGSEDFRRLWARHDVRPLSGAAVRMWHPEVGALELRREKLGIGGTDGSSSWCTTRTRVGLGAGAGGVGVARGVAGGVRVRGAGDRRSRGLTVRRPPAVRASGTSTACGPR